MAHRLLNQNSKSDGGARCPVIYSPLVGALRERGWRIEHISSGSGPRRAGLTPGVRTWHRGVHGAAKRLGMRKGRSDVEDLAAGRR